MLKRFLLGFLSLGLILAVDSAYAGRYGERYCNESGYHCITVKENDSWASLFRSEHERDVVQRLNRMNTRLYPGMRIAVPNGSVSVNDIAPFERSISAPGQKTIIVNQNELAWGAYDANGELVKWGPMSGGKSFCPDVGHSCRTVHGEFTVYTKKGGDCFSSLFPIGKGGAKMPYCMFFHGGYALHGSYEVPGYNASHGCVRIFVQDAQWLNQDFVEVGSTRVIVHEVNAEKEPKFIGNPRPAAKAKSIKPIERERNSTQSRYPNRPYGLY